MKIGDLIKSTRCSFNIYGWIMKFTGKEVVLVEWFDKGRTTSLAWIWQLKPTNGIDYAIVRLVKKYEKKRTPPEGEALPEKLRRVWEETV